MDALFAPSVIAELDEGARANRLRDLEAALEGRLPRNASSSEFFAESRRAIDELRALGHDLWSFDSDGEAFETWCGDWTKPGGGGRLSITFRHPRTVEAAWSRPPSAG
jgi:hypothetical protein